MTDGQRRRGLRNRVIVAASKSGMTQREIAAAFGLPHSRVSAILKEFRAAREGGMPSLEGYLGEPYEARETGKGHHVLISRVGGSPFAALVPWRRYRFRKSAAKEVGIEMQATTTRTSTRKTPIEKDGRSGRRLSREARIEIGRAWRATPQARSADIAAELATRGFSISASSAYHHRPPDLPPMRKGAKVSRPGRTKRRTKAPKARRTKPNPNRDLATRLWLESPPTTNAEQIARRLHEHHGVILSLNSIRKARPESLPKAKIGRPRKAGGRAESSASLPVSGPVAALATVATPAPAVRDPWAAAIRQEELARKPARAIPAPVAIPSPEGSDDEAGRREGEPTREEILEAMDGLRAAQLERIRESTYIPSPRYADNTPRRKKVREW